MLGPARLRALLEDGSPHLLLGVYDAMSAKVGEALGFEILSVSGFGVAGSLLAVPDIGLVSLQESVDVCRRICDASSSMPVIADADTGYGNALSVHRTVRLFESAGAAGLHIEDQVMPKRCGHMGGKQLISPDEMVGKIASALDARDNADFCIIARTDARGVEGLDAALERGRMYHEAGADMLFVEAPQSIEEIERIVCELKCPLLFNWSYDGLTPSVRRSWLEQIGYKFILFPDIIFGTHRSLMRTLSDLISTDSLDALADHLTGFDEFNQFVGLSEWFEREALFIPDDSSTSLTDRSS